MPRSISFCSTFFCASASSARFSASWRSSISVSSRRTLSPFFTAWPSGARNAILKSTSATGGTPISVERTAASSPSTSTVSTRSAFFTVDRRAHVGARGPQRQEEERGGHDGGHEPPAPAAARAAGARTQVRRERHGRPPRAPTPRRTRPACRRRAAPSPSPPPARRTTGPSFSKRTAPRGTLSALAHAPAHHLDAHREARPHQRVGAARARPAPGSPASSPRRTSRAPALPRHRADLLEAPLEDAVGVGVEDAAGLHPGGDPPVVRLGEGGLRPPSPRGRGSVPTG